MFFDSIQIAEGSSISNLTVASGANFPSVPEAGELFFHTTDATLYVYNGSTWVTAASDISLVASVAGRTGAVTLTTSDVSGLSRVASTGSYADLLNVPVFPTVSGTNTGDQTITLTGDITGSGNGTFTATLPNVNSGPVTNSFQKITVNSKGQVLATSNVSAGDITSTLGFTPANAAGNTFTGAVLLASDPTQALGAATKQYVDNIASGLNVHNAVMTSTTSELSANYSNGTAGVGATLTSTSTQALTNIGGYSTPSIGDRILVKDQSNTAQNGIYQVTNLGSSSTYWVLTRAADFDNSPVGEITAGAFTYIQNGSLSGEQWVVSTPGTIAVGTTGIVFTQLGGGLASLSAGTGISVIGSTIGNTGVLSIGSKTGNVSLTSSDISDLAVVATTGSYSSLIGTPALATVATSGNYNDLSNKPSLSGTITLTGDATGSGTGSVAVTLATVNSNVGSYGTATSVPVISVDAKGRVTSVSTATISTSTTVLSGDVTGSGAGSVATTLATVNGNVGSFTTANITVDAKGRITAASSGTPTVAGTSLTGTSLASNVTASSLTSVGTLSSLSVTGAITAGSITGYAAIAANNSWTKAQRGAVVILTPGTSVALDFSAANNFSLAAAQNFTLAFPSSVVAGQSGIIAITQDATGSRVITFASGYVAAGGTKPVLSTAGGAVDYIQYYVETGSRVFVSASLAVA